VLLANGFQLEFLNLKSCTRGFIFIEAGDEEVMVLGNDFKFHFINWKS